MEILTVKKSRGLNGEVKVPGDKSISHRALMFGAISTGITEIEGLSPGRDCFSTVKCLRNLGADISLNRKGTGVVIRGAGLRGLKRPHGTLWAGNSGTTIRLLAGILAGQHFEVILDGDESLRRRPMDRIAIPLSNMGARVSGRGPSQLLPLYIKGGSLSPVEYNLPVASAQVKSCIILASLYARGASSIIEPVPTRNHTELMLKYFGGSIDVEGNRITVYPGSKLEGRSIKVPGDISSAAFIMVAASIVPQSRAVIRDVGINPTRTGIIEVLREMGANIEITNQRAFGMEPVADIQVEYAPLKGVVVRGDKIPRLIDEIPVLAVAASTARGTTIIRDARELRVKESDRIKALATQLGRMGAKVVELEDGMIIEGIEELKGGEVDSSGDHRIAMALAVAGMVSRYETRVKGFEWVDVSYPEFVPALRHLGANISLSFQ